MSHIAILGMGAMGSRMANSLIDRGHRVTVWNRSPKPLATLRERGATIALSPARAVRDCAFAIGMVRDVAASKRIWLDPEDGALPAMPDDAIAIESSTLTLDWVHQLAKAFADRGIGFLDAPVAGSRKQAEARSLAFMVGGVMAAYRKAAPVLAHMGGAVHHVGPVGCGTIVKLSVNALFGIQLATMGELIGFMARAGLEPERGLEVLTSIPVCSPAAKVAAASMLGRQFAPQFPIELVRKDFEYVSATAQANGAVVPMTQAAGDIYREAEQAGFGGDNITGLVRLYAPD